MIRFNSQISILGALPNFEESIVKNEPMFFNASPEFAYENGGEITKRFIELTANACGGIPCVIDTRVHMLMKGWYPCIPGWHHDDVPRTTATGQPNYKTPEYFAKHILGLVNGDICPTQFALGECDLPEIGDDKVCYREWHPQIDNLCNSGKMDRYDAVGNPIIGFDAHSFHQGQKANASGWRWFGRISYDTERTKKITNEIRTQVQVYIPAPDYMGW